MNICRHALRLTGVDRLHGLLGGFHLTGPGVRTDHRADGRRPRRAGADLVVPAHCTGWRAQHRLGAGLPDAFVPNAVGTSFVLAA